MGYFPNTFPNPFTPIQKQANNGIDALASNIQNAIDAAQGVAKGAQVAEKLVLNRAYKAIGSPRIALDPCTFVLQSALGNYVYRNPACNPPNLQQPVPNSPPGTFSIPPNGCTQIITFAFIDSEGMLIGGADKFASLVNGGKTQLPIGTTTQGDASNVYQEGITIFKYAQNLYQVPSIRETLVNLDGVNYSLFSTSINYTDDYLTSTNGLVSPPFPEYLFNSNYTNAPWTIVNIDTGSCVPYTPINPPPPPREKKKMCCCDDNGNNSPANNSNLLKLILQRIGDLPASVPDNFTSAKPNQTTLASLAEMIIWQAQQMDALAGQYPVSMTVKADPTVKDSKDQQISLPNQAETLAEILGLLITTKRDTHANLIATIAAMTEAGLAKKLASTTLDVTLANAEFLGYKLTQKTQNISLQYTPNGKDMATTLTPTTISNITYSNDDKTDLQDDLKKILEMCARWNAQNWRQIGSNAAQSLYSNFIGNNSSVDAATQATRQQTFNQFLSEAEIGFTDVSGVTDSVDPWGEPYANRPILREIGNSNGNYNADGTPKVSDAAPSVIPTPSTSGSSPAGGSSSTSA